MRTGNSIFATIALAALVVWMPPAASAQTGGTTGGAAAAAGGASKSAPAKTAAAFDPRDLNGNWYRTSRYQTFSNVNPTNRFVVGGQQPRDQN